MSSSSSSREVVQIIERLSSKDLPTTRRGAGTVSKLVVVWLKRLLPLVIAYVLGRRSGLFQKWFYWRRRQHARRVRRLNSRLDPTTRMPDPFTRLANGMPSFEALYQVVKKITDSTYGQVLEIRQRDNPKVLRVAKIVPKAIHPLFNTSGAPAHGASRRKDQSSQSPTRRGNEQDSKETETFIRYMHKLLALDHSNVVRYVHFYADHSSFYFVMERCPGRNLVEYLLASNKWYEHSALPVVWHLMEALRYIHKYGLIHRDVKLENLMIFHKKGSSDISLQLLDFGLGCETSNAQGAVGTPGYMAPECFKNKAYSCSVDIFSAGVTFFIMLTGRPPFNAPFSVKYVEQHLEALHRGPCLDEHPLPLVSRAGRDLLDWMLLADGAARCTASEVLRHDWMQRGVQAVAKGHSNGSKAATMSTTPLSNGKPMSSSSPVLWCSSSSELDFLRVMGVFEGSCSRSQVGSRGNLTDLLVPIEEVDAEECSDGFWYNQLDTTRPMSRDTTPMDTDLPKGLCGLVRQMTVSVCIIDSNTLDCPLAVISGGFEELFGYRAVDVLGRSSKNILGGAATSSTSEEVRSQVLKACRCEDNFLGMIPNVRADGKTFDCMLELFPLNVGEKYYVMSVQMEAGSTEELQHDRQELAGISRKVLAAVRHFLQNEPSASSPAQLDS
eukprot:TRINITY_DN40738_c0_g1_i1.p1 TRINITY_DN40738_c0_g1~~TRINITY_DN40738_c0_g1_i1.p1  ORF type:complete len:668 (+),score=121.98 TRINITY_DN40738_c0_g1_i1:159-2162(+)